MEFLGLLGEKSIGGIFFSLSNKRLVCLFGSLEYLRTIFSTIGNITQNFPYNKNNLQESLAIHYEKKFTKLMSFGIN